MQFYARNQMNSAPQGYDDIVVVGRISLNTKKAKRNLVKIAEKNYDKAEATFAKPTQRPRRPRKNTSAPTCTQIVERKAQPSVELFAEVPDGVLAAVFLFADTPTVGRMARTCRGLAVLLGPECAVWANIGAGMGAPMFSVSPRDSLRRWIFGLENGWHPAFSAYAVDADACEVLHECDYLIGGMVATDRKDAASLCKIIQDASDRCLDSDAGCGFLLTTVAKMEARPEVFSRNAVVGVKEANLRLRERGILQRITELDDAPTFDYFQEVDEELPWEDSEPAKEIDPAVNADLAASFLEVLGLRHGLAA
jgi:hypothetical protein